MMNSKGFILALYSIILLFNSVKGKKKGFSCQKYFTIETVRLINIKSAEMKKKLERDLDLFEPQQTKFYELFLMQST